MRRFFGLVFLATSLSLLARDQNAGWQPDLTRLQTYTSHRASSSDPTGANADARRVEPGASLTLLDTDGPGKISHLWFTISSDEPYHLNASCCASIGTVRPRPAWKRRSGTSSV